MSTISKDPEHVTPADEPKPKTLAQRMADWFAEQARNEAAEGKQIAYRIAKAKENGHDNLPDLIEAATFSDMRAYGYAAAGRAVLQKAEAARKQAEATAGR